MRKINLSPFLADKETGQLKKLAENTNWTLSDPNQRMGYFKTASAEILTQYATKTPDEKADYAYGNRPDMGNTQLTDGHKYKGRGLIHLTWKNNYQAATDALNAFYGSGSYDLVTNFESVSSGKTVAALSGAFFWQSPKTTATGKNLNLIADSDNFKETVRGVNGKGVKQKEIDDRTKIWEGIKKLVYDQNAYGNMNEALKALGITASQKKDYNTQFGITLNRRVAQEIVSSGGNKLLAEESTGISPLLPGNNTDLAALQELITDFAVQPGEIDMLFIDAIDALPHQSPPVLVAAATTTVAAKSSGKLYGTIGVCYPASNVKGELSSFHPADAAESVYALKEFPLYEKDYPAFAEYIQTSIVEVLQQPLHGKLMAVKNMGDPGYAGPNSYSYMPDANYKGIDKVVFLATLGEQKVKVIYFIKVIDSAMTTYNHEAIYRKYCPKPSEWLISSEQGGSPLLSQFLDFSGLFGKVDLSFADLPGTAVAQTTGEGTDASITLDTNAAGHNWFIDQTPGTNEEFLPTSNPNQWIAKEGTEAANKMDLLSVLLHEYGHVLGIEHSTYSGDFMAATLQPGVRRMPSSEELALMAQLVGEIKPALGLSNGAAQGNTPDTPLNPSLPVGTTLSALLLGRLRRTGYGSWSPLFDSAQVPAPVPQFAIAANAKLENTQFDGGTGWTTEGDVAFANSPSSGLGAGAATLTETAASQTRLNQVFVLGEHDRFLSFTLANVALGDQAGPDDAFEVALLDANTGLSLLGGTGLSHNDAFLNIQANSSEHKATGITRLDNPDGSRTYLVDLAGIAAGTTVNLAFDLIGFGQGAEASNSQITVRGLRLGVPQTTGDSITLVEDTPAIIDALSNDLNARQPGFVPVIVSGPAHGQVVVNTDGSFTFTPEQDWHGQDTFTYKLSDGHVDSNLATVSLTVTPVNDAPAAGNQQLVAIEDTPLTSSLLAAAADVDNAQLTGSIVAGPQHGQVSVAADGSFSYTPDQ